MAKISVLDYLREFRRNPRSIGSFAESGHLLSKAMAKASVASLEGVIVEFGPGTGVITAQLLAQGVAPNRLLLIEYHPLFAANLRHRFPQLKIIQGDAWKVEDILAEHFPRQKCCAVVSSLPLLNFPMVRREALMRVIDKILDPVCGRFVQFSYGLKKPLEPSANFTLSCSKWIFRNVPPARVWLYDRPKKPVV